MATTPQWLLGKHLTNVSLTGQLVDATTGVWSAGTAYPVTAKTDSIGLASDPELEDIRPVNTVQKNMVSTGEGTSLDLALLLEANVSAELARLVVAYDYCTATFTRGLNIWTGYFRRGRFEDGVKARGKNTASLRLEPCDPGTAQVSLT